MPYCLVGIDCFLYNQYLEVKFYYTCNEMVSLNSRIITGFPVWRSLSKLKAS